MLTDQDWQELPYSAFLNRSTYLVDSDSTNYVAINGSVLVTGVASSVTLVTTPAHTFVNDEYVGFIIRGDAGPIDLGLLTGITITTYNNGVPTGESASTS